ncbi:hypothetical protein [Methylophaga sp. OBS3]|uniref:hypothetical protein n=1 Tax=Methylophaga sp. OBS3 TaxID=2991934 RepID=UPI00224FB1FC|nr:hypothetical protein [Methylophaga sp. OBS3]MCX4190647.1 hypothetical protein [Methylophaga sp. OBS3]
MKMIGLLVTLLIIGWLLNTQLALFMPNTQSTVEDEEGVVAAPTTVQQIESFEQDINQLMTDTQAERARQIEQSQ